MDIQRSYQLIDAGSKFENYVAPKIREQAIAKSISVIKAKHRHGLIKFQAAIRLGALEAVEAIPELIQLLEHEDKDTRWSALEALGRLEARESIPKIKPLLNDNSEFVKCQAILISGYLGDTEVLPQLKELLDHRWRGVATIARGVIPRLEKRKAEITHLVESLSDRDVRVRSEAIMKLGKLRAFEVLTKLEELKSNDKDGIIRKFCIPQAIELINRPGPRELQGIPNLDALLKNDDLFKAFTEITSLAERTQDFNSRQ